MQEAEYKIGQAVFFVHGFGDTHCLDKMYRYGRCAAGYITDIEYIHAHDTYLYTVGSVTSCGGKHIYKTLGKHMIFTTPEECFNKVIEICVEVDTL